MLGRGGEGERYYVIAEEKRWNNKKYVLLQNWIKRKFLSLKSSYFNENMYTIFRPQLFFVPWKTFFFNPAIVPDNLIYFMI